MTTQSKKLTKHILIGFNGYMGAGKDTSANFAKTYFETLYPEIPVYTMSFAEPLKKGLCEFFGWELSIFDQETKNVTDKEWQTSPRKAAQFIGTDFIREAYGQDFWIRRLKRKIDKLLEPSIVIITDVRFDNEREFILTRTGYIYVVVRDNPNIVSTHPSENLFKVEGERMVLIQNTRSLDYLRNRIQLEMDVVAFDNAL
jgi:hypothetical protein